MKQIVALIALAFATPFVVPTHASAEAAAVSPVAAPGIDVPRHPLEILRGVIASIDEQNDRIVVQLPLDITADLKVRDGLLFNAVRYGDPVEVTVQDIDGAKTIVSLKEE